MNTSYLMILTLLIGFLFFTGCDTSTEPGITGNFVLYLTDAPGEYDEVNISVEYVEVHKADGGWITINNQPGTYNLLELTNGVTAVLGEAMLDAGKYTQIRLLIGEGSNVVLDGQQYNLFIPSGIQTGLKLVQAFEIEPDYTYELLLDFDAHRSVRRVGQSHEFILQPAYRLQSIATSGSIAGSVEPEGARAVVTVYENGEVVTTTYADEETGAYKIIHLPEGSYSLHFKAREEGYGEYTQNDVMVSVGETTTLGLVTLD
jgi:hypothetical protein